MPLPLVAMLLMPADAAAATSIIDVPSGTVADAAFAIARQGGVSVAFHGGGTANRRIAGLRGRMAPADALRRIAAAADLELRSVGPRAFVLAPRRPSPVRAAAARPPKIARPVAAAPTPPEEPQEVVVTASKRDTLARRFPGQWSRIEGDDLSFTGTRGTEAIESRTIGFSSTHLGAGRNKLFIRGIADSSFSGPTQSPVGQYFGDLRTGYAGPDPDLRLVDMRAVEVLEGPQGTLYGAGALGGILLLHPAMPERGTLGGRIGGGLSQTQHGETGYDLNATLNAPLGDHAAIRATGYRTIEGGYVDNRLTGLDDINRVRVTGGRLVASADLTPDWTADMVATGQWIRGSDSQYADRGGDGLSRSSAFELPFASDFGLASLVLRKDRGDLRVRSTNGFTWQDVDERFDLSGASDPRELRQTSRARGFSSETRLWRPMRRGYSWLLGVSLLDHRYTVRRKSGRPGAPADLGGVENRINEVTVYGEVGAEIGKAVDVSAGARFTETRLEGEGQHLSLLAFDRLSGADPKARERRLLPSASLLARPVDGLGLYLRYQQGFRPGGLSIANDHVQRYRHDLLTTIEGGARLGKPLVTRFDLAASVSRSRWKDIQADFLDQGGLPVTANIGDGTVWSATLNGGIRLSPAMRLEGGLAWNHGEVTRPSPELSRLFVAAAAGTEVMRIPNIARIAGRTSLDLRHDFGRDRLLEVNLYARYVGSSRLGVGPRLGEKQGDYLDTGLTARLASGRRTLSFALTNIADAVGNRFSFGAPVQAGTEQRTPLRPRTARIGLDWAF